MSHLVLEIAVPLCDQLIEPGYVLLDRDQAARDVEAMRWMRQQPGYDTISTREYSFDALKYLYLLTRAGKLCSSQLDTDVFFLICSKLQEYR